MKIEIPLSPWEDENAVTTAKKGRKSCSTRKPTPYRVRKEINDKSPPIQSFSLDRMPLSDIENDVVTQGPVVQNVVCPPQRDLIMLTPIPKGAEEFDEAKTPTLLTGLSRSGASAKSNVGRPRSSTVKFPDLLSFDPLEKSDVNDNAEEICMLKDKIEFLEQQLAENRPVDGEEVGLSAMREEIVALEKEVAELKDCLVQVDNDRNLAVQEMERGKEEVSKARREISEIKATAVTVEMNKNDELSELKKSSSLKECALHDRIAKLKHLLHQTVEEKEDLMTFMRSEKDVEKRRAENLEKKNAALEKELEEMKRHACNQGAKDMQTGEELQQLAEENDALLRQLRYVTNKLLSHQAELEDSVPQIGRLAKELKKWFNR